MKSVHLVEIKPFIGGSRERESLQEIKNAHSTFYFEYVLEDGQLFMGDNDGYVIKKGHPHREFKVKGVIQYVESLPTELRDNESLYKWENNTRIRCSIEEAKKYFEDNN